MKFNFFNGTYEKVNCPICGIEMECLWTCSPCFEKYHVATMTYSKRDAFLRESAEKLIRKIRIKKLKCL